VSYFYCTKVAVTYLPAPYTELHNPDLIYLALRRSAYQDANPGFSNVSSCLTSETSRVVPRPGFTMVSLVGSPVFFGCSGPGPSFDCALESSWYSSWFTSALMVRPSDFFATGCPGLGPDRSDLNPVDLRTRRIVVSRSRPFLCCWL